MPSNAVKKRQQQKKKSGQDKKKDGGKGTVETKVGGATPSLGKISSRSCTGVLTSHVLSRDIHFEKLSLTFHGAELLSDAKLELNCGQRYGLVGLNGSGEF